MDVSRSPSVPREIDIESIVLQAGSHKSIEDGGCVMEWAAHLAGEPWSDHPACVCPVIAAFLRTWNDAMSDADRQILKALIPVAIGTASTPEVELERAYLALDWLCRVNAPAWLRLAGLTADAEAIEATEPIVDPASATAAQVALDAARRAAYQARDAAVATAGDAAVATAGDAAGATVAAARATVAAAGATAVATVAARDATYAAVAARDAAYATVAATVAAAGATAGDAAYVAAYAAGATAYVAAVAKLHPTVVTLQASALDLVTRMAALGEERAS